MRPTFQRTFAKTTQNKKRKIQDFDGTNSITTAIDSTELSRIPLVGVSPRSPYRIVEENGEIMQLYPKGLWVDYFSRKTYPDGHKPSWRDGWYGRLLGQW